MKILFDPNGSNGGGGASSVSADTAVMDGVFDKLGLPEELRGTPAAKEPTAEEKAAAEAKAAEKAEADRVAALTPEERAAEEAAAADAAGADDQAIVDAMSEEERTALEAMTPEDRAAAIEAARAAAAEAEAGAEPEFTAEQRAWIDAQTATTTQELETARAEVERLTAELDKASTTPHDVAGVHPLFLEDQPANLDKQDAVLAQFEKWALAYWDGTEEIPAEGTKPGVPAYTGAQIRQRYAEVREVREKLIPAAKQAIATRKAHQDVARKNYPELFDNKRPESKIAENILAQAPGLKAVFPQIYMIIGDAIVGERIRQEKAKRAAAGKPGVKPAAGKPAPKLAPKPGSGGAGSRVVPKPKPKQEISAQRFQELGGDRNALITMLQTANLPVLAAGEK